MESAEERSHYMYFKKCSTGDSDVHHLLGTTAVSPSLCKPAQLWHCTLEASPILLNRPRPHQYFIPSLVSHCKVKIFQTQKDLPLIPLLDRILVFTPLCYPLLLLTLSMG